MTPQELNQMISIIGALRRCDCNSTVARRLELQACGEMLLQVPLKTGGPEDAILPLVSQNMARGVLVGIIQGRAGEGPQPWTLKPLILNPA